MNSKEKKNGGSHLAPQEKVKPEAKPVTKGTEPEPGKKSAGKSGEKLKKGCRKSIVITAVVVGLLLIIAVAALLFINGKLNLIDYNDGKLPDGHEDAVVDDRAEVDISELEVWDAPIPATESTAAELADDEGVFNIMLLGTDGLNEEYTHIARADCTMLLSLDLENHSAYLTSFERGIGMPITSGEHEGEYDLITHIFRHGGADMVVQDVRECFSIDVERYVRINFNSLIKVIDVLGGIELELTEREAWYLNAVKDGNSVGPYLNQGYVRFDLDAPEHDFVTGMNTLTGSMALAYSRLRGIDDDWRRIERQRKVIQACANSLMGADLSTLNNLINEILPLVQTNLTKQEIAALMLEAPNFLGVQFNQLTIPEQGSYGGMTGLYGAGMLAVDFEYNSKLLHEFIYGD